MGTKGRQAGAGRRRGKHRWAEKPGGKCSEVTVTKPDGTTETLPALTARQLQSIVKERRTIDTVMRDRIKFRDRGACRYCQRSDCPVEIDHVVPIALGGSNRIGNLVVACDLCNRRKGANVWRPKPLDVHRAIVAQQSLVS